MPISRDIKDKNTSFNNTLLVTKQLLISIKTIKMILNYYSII